MTNIDTEIIYDKNGKPIPQYLDVTDKTGGSAGTMKPITGQNGAQFTQLTGSNVEYRKVETILPRAIYSSRFTKAVFEQPKWANSAVFYLILYGSSGQFEGGEGASLETILYGSNSARYYGVAHEGVTTSGALQATEWGTSVNDGNIETSYPGSVSYKAVPISFVSDLKGGGVRAFITGTFDEGEGIDCEIKVAWLRG